MCVSHEPYLLYPYAALPVERVGAPYAHLPLACCLLLSRCITASRRLQRLVVLKHPAAPDVLF